MTTATEETIKTTLDGKTRELRIFPRISGDAFQHASDRDAGNAVQSLPFFPEFFRVFAGSYGDQFMRMENLTNMLRIGPDQGAALYQRLVLAARILDVQELPEFYLNGDIRINAYAGGLNRPMVVLQRGIIGMLSEAELLAIIGHELGHIKCRHSLNQALTSIFTSVGVGQVAAMFPIIGTVAAISIKQALLHWRRLAEFSCDRAGLLVVQDPQVAASAMAKIAGFQESVVPDFNFDALLRQIDDYDRYDENCLQAVTKIQRNVQLAFDEDHPYDHPWPILRVKRILDWGKSDQYLDILKGQYPRETGTPRPTLPVAADAPKCVHCGNFMTKGATYCSFCGHRL